jgi:hypothetical protein
VHWLRGKGVWSVLSYTPCLVWVVVALQVCSALCSGYGKTRYHHDTNTTCTSSSSLSTNVSLLPYVRRSRGRYGRREGRARAKQLDQDV